MRMVPYRPLSASTTITGNWYCTAVEKSCPVIRKSPSPAMQTLHPDRAVVCIAGDGDFLMTGQDFSTAVQYQLPVIVVLADNGLYGTIRMHQERDYPGRVIATELKNPDFVAYAKAFGGFGVLVEKTAAFPAAFAAAQKSGKPSIIHLKVDPEEITPTMTLTGIREKALAGGGGKTQRS